MIDTANHFSRNANTHTIEFQEKMKYHVLINIKELVFIFSSVVVIISIVPILQSR